MRTAFIRSNVANLVFLKKEKKKRKKNSKYELLFVLEVIINLFYMEKGGNDL